MPRTKNSVVSRQSRKKTLKQARGFRGSRKNLIRQAYTAVNHSKANAFVGRKQKKREYRRLWTTRINNACREAGLTYNRFMYGLRQQGVELNRKALADMAVNDPEAFQELVESAKQRAEVG